MAPTEILAVQHYNLAKTIFKGTNIKIGFLTGKTKISDKKIIINKLSNGKINLLIGTHALFQKKIFFRNLGLVIIDEQHKFGVKQRLELAYKGGNDCDILLMSATPIPRTLILTLYGDMDISRLIEKPANRKKIITLSKPEEKINEVFTFLKELVTPLILNLATLLVVSLFPANVPNVTLLNAEPSLLAATSVNPFTVISSPFL